MMKNAIHCVVNSLFWCKINKKKAETLLSYCILGFVAFNSVLLQIKWRCSLFFCLISIQSSWLESAVCLVSHIFMCGMMNDSERCVNSFQGSLQLPLHSSRIWKTKSLGCKYARFERFKQDAGCQLVTWNDKDCAARNNEKSSHLI